MTGAARKKEAPKQDPRAEVRRRALREHLDAAGMTPTEIARASGVNVNSLYNFLNGHSKALSQGTLELLAKELPGASIDSLSGRADVPEAMPDVRPITVRAIAVAGLLQSSFDLPPRRQRQVYMPITPEMQTLSVFAVEVGQPGAEKMYAVRSLLVCIPMQNFEGALESGNKVILQRIVGGKVEVTVCELEIQANEAWLWLRSTHPEHQRPIRLPYTPGQLPRPWADKDTRFSLIAIVDAAYIPQR